MATIALKAPQRPPCKHTSIYTMRRERETLEAFNLTSGCTAIHPTRSWNHTHLPDRGRQGAAFEVINPATERVVSVCANADEEDVDEAVKSARKW